MPPSAQSEGRREHLKLKRWLAAFGIALASCLATAQTPIAGGGTLEFVVIFPADFSADVSARIRADGIAKHLEQAVPVSNKPGGGGAIGYKYVAFAKLDGRTIVWNSNSVSTTFYSGAMDIDYKSFEPVARALSVA